MAIIYISPFLVELIYTTLIIVACGVIFFRTKQLYELTNHPGIKFFRYTFLFFGLAYLSRFSLHVFRLIHLNRGLVYDLIPYLFFFTAYAGSMAILALLYSVLWKKLPERSMSMIPLHFIALLTAAVGLIAENSVFVLLFQSVLFLIALILIFKETKFKHIFTQIYTVYIFLFFVWLLNILSVIVPRFLFPIQVGIDLASIILFSIILIGVLKRTRRGQWLKNANA